MASRPSPPTSAIATLETAPRKHRIPLGASRRRLSYERRLRLWLAVLALPSVLLLGSVAFQRTGSIALTIASVLAFACIWAIASAYLFDQLVRPLQTLANVVAALREDDFSFRARGAKRGDSLGDLALEINFLAGTLQHQRLGARDALTLVEQVMTSMQSPVLAFSPTGNLRLLNQAAGLAFGLPRQSSIDRSAADLDLTALLAIGDGEVYSPTAHENATLLRSTRWSVRRTSFRLHGVPHTLVVLSDVASALREEERVAWQRLIRVLSHEINNSLTPIKSIAGSLRSRLSMLEPNLNSESAGDFGRGLTIIEDRAASLNRFLQAYQQLTRLPAPRFKPIVLQDLLEQVISLETRLVIRLEQGPPLMLDADADQLQQLLINLLRNAVEAALGRDAPHDKPEVSLGWNTLFDQVVLHITDNGPGLTNTANLFVPFYTTKPEGSGIGLILAQQIATAHKGTVTLANREDAQGCMAELRLPLQHT